MSDDGSTLQRAGTTERPIPGVAQPTGDLVGRHVLQFRVVARLGEGGMGVVYKAHDDKLRRDVALKVLAARYLADDRNKELLFREARSAAAVTHPCVAAIYDVHEADGVAFLAMEYVEGETLRAQLARGALAIEPALAVALDIARGLARAHELAVVHRDLKPDNVMLAAGNHVKLLDFGLAKVVCEADPIAGDSGPGSGDDVGLHPTVPASSPETRAGRVMGTPAYMPPEQARGEPVDARADVFAFGATLYELLAGTPPFAGRAGPPTDWSDADYRYEPLRARRRDVPRAVDELVSRCLELRPDERFADAGEIVAALGRVAPGRRSRSPVATVAALLAAAGLAAGGVVLATRAGDPTPSTTASAAAACDSAPTLDARWNDSIRAATRARLHNPSAADDLAAFDDFAARWRTLHHDACIVAAGDPTRGLGAKQLSCLETALDQFATQVDRPRFALTPDARPALPDATRCTGANPGRPITEHPIAKSAGASVSALLSPDGTRYASRAGPRLVVTSLATGVDEADLAIPNLLNLVGWTGDRITVFDGSHVLFADVVRHVVELGGAIPPTYVAISPDGTRFLDQDAAGDVYLVSLVDGTRSVALANLGIVDGRPAWSSTDQIALCQLDGTTIELSVIDLPTRTVTKVALRLDESYLGNTALVWRDRDTLQFVGRSELDRGSGLWSATFRHGRLDGPIKLVVPAPLDTVFDLLDARPGEVLANHITVHNDLARIRNGRAEHIANAPSARWVGSVDARAQRASVVRESDSGIVSLADGSYTRLADGVVWTAFDGDRLVELDDQDLILADARTHTRTRTLAHSLPFASAVRGGPKCARDAPGHCAIMLVGPAKHGMIAALDGEVIGPPIDTGGAPSKFSISPDGRAVAIAEPGRIDIIDLATGAHDPIAMPAALTCPGSTQFTAWGVARDTIFATIICERDGVSHLFELERGKPPEDVYESAGWISGLAVGDDNVPVVGIREFSPNVVILDGL